MRGGVLKSGAVQNVGNALDTCTHAFDVCLVSAHLTIVAVGRLQQLNNPLTSALMYDYIG